MTATRRLAFDAALMTGGRIGFVALWFLAVAMVYRDLGADAGGVAQAGLFAMCIAVIKVVSGCITDPMDLALMRRVPGLLHSDPPAAFRLLRAAFGLRALGAILVAAMLFGFAPDLAELLLHRRDAAGLLAAVAAGIVGDMALRAVLIVLQAGQRFVAFVALEGAMQVMRFAAVVMLWASGTMSVELVLWSYGAASAVAAAGGLLLLPRGLLAGIHAGWSDVRELLAYIKWMMPGMMLAALNERFDLFLVSAWTGPEAAGLYGAMLALAMVPDLIAGCLSSVIQPRIMQILHSGRFGHVTRMFLFASVPLCACAMLAALPLAAPVIGLVLGPAYLPGVQAFLWVLAGTLFWLAVAPLPLTLLAVVVPSRLVLLTLLQSVILVLLGVALLPVLGIVGMAQTVFAARVIVALVALVAALRLARATPAEGLAPPLPRQAA